MEKLFVYHRPNVMVGHKYSDDVAITKAETKEEALANFRKLYDLADDSYIDEVYFNFANVAILTDY